MFPINIDTNIICTSELVTESHLLHVFEFSRNFKGNMLYRMLPIKHLSNFV